MALKDLMAKKDADLKKLKDSYAPLGYTKQKPDGTSYFEAATPEQIRLTPELSKQKSDNELNFKLRSGYIEKYYSQSIKAATQDEQLLAQDKNKELQGSILKARAIRYGTSSYGPALGNINPTAPSTSKGLGSGFGKTLLGN